MDSTLGNVFPSQETVRIMRNKSVVLLLLVGLLLTVHLAPFAVAQSDGDETPASMTRIMMLPPDAEVTGMNINAQGHFFVNAMHPDEDNYKATIGVINGVDWNAPPPAVPELPSSSSEGDVWHGIRTSYGDYQVILQSGDALSEGGLAGGIYAADDGEQLFVSQKPDYNAFVPLNADGSRGYLYTAWEDRPAGISQTELNWNTTSLQWDVASSRMLNLSEMNGGWVLCFGSMSPWGAPLFSEELYFDNTEKWNDASFNYHADQERLANYLGSYPNPYDYGYIVEVGNADTPEPDLTKHFAMGRFSHENAQVMPDERTVYLTDDGYDTVLFKFVADVTGDLSSGTLYAAHLDQDDSRDSAITGFDVEWLELGTSSNAEIQTWIDEYDGITTSDFVAGQNSYISDEAITNWAEGRLNEDLNGDGTIGSAADDRVAFLESRKAAAALGASDEWNKMEGVAFNVNAPEHLYLAMSDVGYDMSDGQGDIDVTQNRCGIVYQLPVHNGWDVKRIEPAIIGGAYTSSAQYECDINNLAGPDNLLVLDDGRVLVGEDTGKHESNMVWLWQPPNFNGVEPAPNLSSETIAVNSVTLVQAPDDKQQAWNYTYQAEVNGLQADTSYTAILLIKQDGDDGWRGFSLWNTIDGDGDQYDHAFSAQRGCYFINASLYESGDFNADAVNATVLAATDFEFTVGGGTCTEGVYAEAADATQTPDEVQDDKDEVSEGLPGFGLLPSLIAALGALLVTRRHS